MSLDSGANEFKKFSALTEEGKASEALVCLDKACKLGNVEALLTKARIVGYADNQALSEYRRLVESACEKGSAEAWVMRGDLLNELKSTGDEIFALDDGISGEKKENFISLIPTLRKFDCYVKASALGSVHANAFLGETLLKPEFSFVAEQDAAKEAVYYFKKGAAGGDAECLLHLAECIEDGVGTEKNISKAIDIYKELAEYGNKDAMLHLSEIYSVGKDGVEPDRETAMKYMFMTGLTF